MAFFIGSKKKIERHALIGRWTRPHWENKSRFFLLLWRWATVSRVAYGSPAPLDSIRQLKISTLDCGAPSKSKQIKWGVRCLSGTATNGGRQTTAKAMPTSDVKYMKEKKKSNLSDTECRNINQFFYFDFYLRWSTDRMDEYFAIRDNVWCQRQ